MSKGARTRRGRRPRRVLVGGLVAGLVATLAPVVGPTAHIASAQSAGSLEIAPSRTEQDVAAGAVQVPVTITNHAPTTRRVTITLTGLGHDLDGVPLFGSAPGWATLEPVGSFDVPGGASMTTLLTFDAPAGVGRYAAVLASIRDEDGSLSIESRVASLVLIRGPQPWEQRIAVTGVEMRRTGDRTYRVSALLDNQGDVHVRPTGTVELRRGTEVLATVPLDRQLVLPGYQRRLSGTWTAPADVDPADLDAVVVVDEPGAGGTFTPVETFEEADPTGTGPDDGGVDQSGGGGSAASIDGRGDVAGDGQDASGDGVGDGSGDVVDEDAAAARTAGLDPGVALGAGIAVLVLVAVSVAGGIMLARQRERRRATQVAEPRSG